MDVVFSSHSPKFNFDEIPENYEKWTKFNDGEGLTARSIAFWCRTDAPESYEMIHKDSVDYYVERCFKDKQLNTATEHDVATLLYFMLKTITGALSKQMERQRESLGIHTRNIAGRMVQVECLSDVSFHLI